MATHSSILAWEIPWTEEPGGLQTMGLQSRRRLSNSKSVRKWSQSSRSDRVPEKHHYITWKLFSNGDSLASPQSYWIKNSGIEAQRSVF